MAKKDEDFKFEIKEHIEDLSDANEKGWKIELNVVSWNGGEDKYDIRSWNFDHTKMGKGISLTYDQIALLGSALFDKGIC